MKHPLSVTCALALLVGSVPALAVDVKAEEDPGAKVICKREAVTGSRLPGPKVCRTRAEWDADKHAAKEDVRKAQQNTRTIDPGAG